jgi:hypothetical protein
VVDADEIFYYPDCEHKTISQLCQVLDQHYKKACPAILLDMYSNLKIKDTDYQKGQNFLEVCPYFDKKFYHRTEIYAPPYDNQIDYLGGARERIFGKRGDFHLSKIPLIKYSLDMTLSDGQHFVDSPSSEIAETRGCLLHFKYFSSFVNYANTEKERKEHSQNGLHYQIYHQKLLENSDLSLYDSNYSLKFQNSQQLVDLGIMKRGEIAENKNSKILVNKTKNAAKKLSHILFYTDCWSIFGAEQWNHSLMKALIKNCYRLSCAQLETTNHLIQEREELGIKHFWLEKDSLYQNVKPPRSITNTSEPRKIFDLVQPDLIIFSNGTPLSNLAAQKVAAEKKIPFLQIVHRVESSLKQEEKLYLEYLSDIYQEAKEIIAVSRENLDLLYNLFKLPQNKGSVISPSPEEYILNYNELVPILQNLNNKI